MTGKPALFALLAVAGLGAAGVGGYLAMSPAAEPVAPAAATAVAPDATTPRASAVAETESVVAPVQTAASATSAKPTPAEPIEAPRTSSSVPARRDARLVQRPAPAAPRTSPTPVEAVRPTPTPPVAVRDEMPRPTPEPAREPAPTVVEASREASRPGDERTIPDAPPAPRAQEFIVPADSVIGLRLEDSLSSETARLEQRVEARVTREVRVNGTVVIPAGARARGEVTLVEPGGRFKERARLGVRFHTLVLADGSTVPIETETVFREGDEVGKKAATRIGASAVGGAIVGAIFGGGRGAAIGAAAGAGAGTAATVASPRSQATLPAGSTVTVRLTGPATITIEE